MGSLLYYLLTDNTPFNTNDPDTVKEKTLSGNFSLDSNGPLSRSLTAVIRKSMSFETSDRYATVDELMTEIRAYMNGFATKAEEANSLTIFMLFLKRFRVLSATVLFFMLCIGLITFMYVNSLNEKHTIAVDAQQESMKIRKETAPELVILARKEYKLRDYKSASQKVEMALKLDPENQHARLIKVRCLTGQHNFKEALHLIEGLDNPSENQQLIDILKRFIQLSSSGEIIVAEELPGLIQQLRTVKHMPNLRKHFLQTCTSENYKIENRILFAKRYQSSITSKNFNWVLKEDNAQFSLDLSNNVGMYNVAALRNLPINKLKLTNSPVNELTGLEGMPLKELDISNTNVSDLLPVKGAPLKVLNINGTNVRNFGFIKTLPVETLILNKKLHDYKLFMEIKTLKKLFIHPEFFTTAEIQQLKTHCQVEFIKP